MLAHAALLAVRFVDPESINRVLRETPLEVILVNASTNERPEKAQAIAQRSLAGGGDAAEGARHPPAAALLVHRGGRLDRGSPAPANGGHADPADAAAGADPAQLAAMPLPDPRNQGTPAEAAQQEEKRRQLLELLAEIERRVNEENARPKKRYISPATREAVYAAYVDALRRRIEARGTQNFPEAGGKKLYGQLTMLVTVNHDGSLIGTEVVVSSGNPTLDRRAQAIVRASATSASSPMRCGARPTRSCCLRASSSRAKKRWRRSCPPAPDRRGKPWISIA